MKIVLGVLEDDVLGVDVGLEDVDPRRLAEGEADEVRYVGEVLCWLGRKTGYLDEISREDERPRMAVDPEAETSESSSGRSQRKAGRATREKDETVDEDVFGPVRAPNAMSPSIASTSLDSSLLMHSTGHADDDSHTAMSLHDELREGEDGREDPSVASERNLDDLSILQPRRNINRGHAFPQHGHPPLQPDETIDLDEVTAFLDSRANRPRNQSQPLNTSSERDTPRRPIRVPSRRYDNDSDSDLGQGESIEESFCRCTPKELPPVRRTGYIDTVDFEEELRSFETQRRWQKTPTSAHLSRNIGSRPRFPVSSFHLPDLAPFAHSPISRRAWVTGHRRLRRHVVPMIKPPLRFLRDIHPLRNIRLHSWKNARGFLKSLLG